MFKLFMKKNNKKGFTLVELMVVVAIIGVLVAIAVPVYNNSQKTAKTNACLANSRIIEGAIEMYRIDENEAPTDLADLVPKYIKETPVCPFGTDYVITDGALVAHNHGDTDTESEGD